MTETQNIEREETLQGAGEGKYKEKNHFENLEVPQISGVSGDGTSRSDTGRSVGK